MKLLEMKFELEDEQGRKHTVSASFDAGLGFQQWGAVESVLYDTWPVLEYLAETERDDVRTLLWGSEEEE